MAGILYWCPGHILAGRKESCGGGVWGRIEQEGEADFRGAPRGNQTRASATDPDARLERRLAIDGRTTRHAGYALGLRVRKRVERRRSPDLEEVFGWMRTVGGLRKTRHRDIEHVGWMFTFVAAAYTLVRLPKLLADAGWPCPDLSGVMISAARTA